MRRDFAFPEAPCTFTILSDGRKFPPWGLAGGKSASKAKYLRNPEGAAEELPSKITLELAKGESVSIQTPGGGGFGDPKRRDRAAVRRDVRDGKVSAVAAREVYGLTDV